MSAFSELRKRILTSVIVLSTLAVPKLANANSNACSNVLSHVPDEQVLSILGEGMFGKVYLVSNENNQLLAKKIYDPDIPRKYKSLKNIRSLLDIEALKLFLAISNVVGGIKVIEILKTEITRDSPKSKFGSLNVYMKYIKGKDLESLLHDGTNNMTNAELKDIRDRYNLAVDRISSWLRENGQNVDEKAYLYSMKYGDISNSGMKMLYADVQLEGFSGKIMLKPDNVLVGPNLELYIIDPY